MDQHELLIKKLIGLTLVIIYKSAVHYFAF